MGSLISHPKAPQPQPVYIPVPAPAPVQAVTPAPAADTTATPTTADTAQPAQTDNAGTAAPTTEAQRLAREDSLLQRSRGRIGTVLTGLSGILTQTAKQGTAKTLLGE